MYFYIWNRIRLHQKESQLCITASTDSQLTTKGVQPGAAASTVIQFYIRYCNAYLHNRASWSRPLKCPCRWDTAGQLGLAPAQSIEYSRYYHRRHLKLPVWIFWRFYWCHQRGVSEMKRWGEKIPLHWQTRTSSGGGWPLNLTAIGWKHPEDYFKVKFSTKLFIISFFLSLPFL